MRGGWEDDRYGGGYEQGGGGYDREYDRPPARHFNRGSKPKEEDLEGFQPAMMSFKAFLQTQDDQISDEDAIKKYAEYKLEFKRQQLNEFFVTHKDEEWFKQKYHPDDSVKRKDELREMLKRRVEVFQEFVEQGKFTELTLDGDKQDDLIKVLDSVVIKLEGGSDFDITVLDLPDQEEEQKKEEAKKKRDDIGEKKGSTPSNDTFDDENAELMKKAKEFLNFMDPADEKKAKEEESRKRKRDDDSEEKDYVLQDLEKSLADKADAQSLHSINIKLEIKKFTDDIIKITNIMGDMQKEDIIKIHPDDDNVYMKGGIDAMSCTTMEASPTR